VALRRNLLLRCNRCAATEDVCAATASFVSREVEALSLTKTATAASLAFRFVDAAPV